MIKYKLTVLALALCFGALGLATGIHQKRAMAQGAAPTGTVEAPVSALLGTSLPDAKGQMQALSQWKGKALLVNFWASWCGPCVREMPELSALSAQLAEKKVQVLGVGIDSPSNIAEFSAKLNVAYPLYVGGMGGSDLARQFGDTGASLPFTVLIGADGKVRKQYLGALDFAKLKADLALL